MSEWQPIETAPRDGTEVILYFPEWCGEKNMVETGFWDQRYDGDINAAWEFAYGSGDSATHWMPIPAPPE